MKSLHALASCSLALALAACASTAPDENYTERAGQKLLTGFARYQHASNSNNVDQEGLTLDLDAGYLLGDHHELGLSVDGLFTRTEVADGHSFAVGPFYNYIFKLGTRTSLYLGPEVLFQDFDTGQAGGSTSEVGYGGHVGLRFWYSPHVSLVVEPSYLHTGFDDAFGGSQDLTRVKVGIAVKF